MPGIPELSARDAKGLGDGPGDSGAGGVISPGRLRLQGKEPGVFLALMQPTPLSGAKALFIGTVISTQGRPSLSHVLVFQI